jgi:predicted transposase/invertase (TIGR01784 family)
MKRLLRNKANFEVLEGFLSELLRRKIIIKYIGESEGNKAEEDDKYNRVDLFAEADDKELVIIELQYYTQNDYFQRILYGVSKSITEHIDEGDEYEKVRKLYSISIVYFDLGKGDDYVYHGSTDFRGLHTNNKLELTATQRQLYHKTTIAELYPEYYIIKVKGFDDVAKNTLDEWIYYLKNSKIRDDFTAQGFSKARMILAYDKLTAAEKQAYQSRIKDRRIRDSEVESAFIEGETKGEAKGLEKGEAIGLEKGEAIGLEKGEAIGLEKGEAERAKLEAEKEAAQKLAAEQAARIAELEQLLTAQAPPTLRP